VKQAEKEPNGRRLAATARSDHTDDRTLRDIEGHVAHDRLVERLAQP
jgi:hypothetical protein